MRDNGTVPQLRIALAQIDHTVGDLAGNAARVLGASPARRPRPARTWSRSPR